MNAREPEQIIYQLNYMESLRDLTHTLIPMNVFFIEQ